MNKKFYITTTLPYVNAEPHIGHAAEFIKADCIARYQRMRGNEVFFNTGTDEHGLKIYRKAVEAGKDIQKYCDEYAARFDGLKKALDLSYDNFIRTTDEHHMKAAQEFWKLCEKRGDIYKKKYKVKYCVGCELEKTDSELEDGKCPLHPKEELEIIDEENYFFRFSKYQKPLLEFYKKHPDFVLPDFRFNEIKAFVERGLEDFSISRLKSKMPWGVPVPGDDTQVMYVWFDALVNYISCLGWPNNFLPLAKGEAEGVSETDKPPLTPPSKEGEEFSSENLLNKSNCDNSTMKNSEKAPFSSDSANSCAKNLYKEFWPGVQVCGKDNLRQQTAIWQAMLLSAGLPNSRQVLVFGFITADGQKMSKSLGNGVSPYDLVDKYGTDAVRYFLLKEIKPFSDSDYSQEKFETLYNADLANGLGNLAARVSNLLEKNDIEVDLKEGSDNILKEQFEAEMDVYKFDIALEVLWKKIRESDELLSNKKPWKMEDREEIKKTLEPIAQNILNISILLGSFMPETAGKLKDQFSHKKIKKTEPLFPRI